MKPTHLVAARVLLCLLSLLCLAAVLSCQRDTDLEGTYEAANPADKEHTVMLALRPDGNGWWTVDGEELPFVWERRDRQIWLHTKSGGMIVGSLADDRTITMSLPGVGDLSFIKKSN